MSVTPRECCDESKSYSKKYLTYVNFVLLAIECLIIKLETGTKGALTQIELVVDLDGCTDISVKPINTASENHLNKIILCLKFNKCELKHSARCQCKVAETCPRAHE